MSYIVVKIPTDILYTVDWHGWLIDNEVSGMYNVNWNYIIFDFPEDLLAFKLKFGI